MAHSHVSAAEVALFVSGHLGRPALRSFLRQILHPCAECREKLRFYASPPDDLERQILLWAEEHAGLARLRARGGAEAFDGSYSRFKHVGRTVHGQARIEHLLELSREMRYRDPGQMWLLALGAASAASTLGSRAIDQGRYSPAQKADLRARTQIELANAYRLNHDFGHAEECLQRAADLIREGGCAPRTLGRLMDIFASVLMDQRRLEEACGLLDNLHRHYLGHGETHLAGRTLISKGIALHRDDRPEEAAATLRQGLTSLTAGRDPELLSSGQQALIFTLVEAGSFGEAGKLLMESGLRHAFSAQPLNLLKLRWVEGKIFAGLGKLRRAEEIFVEVKEEFRLHDRRYLIAMVSLELAGVLLRQGRAADVEPLAEEALEIFHELAIGREALRAVRFLREACRWRMATADLVDQVVKFLSRLERQPGLRFLA